eukprot:gnl/TRDRNA2_/TRDRNA2_177650_c1_seq1.p1 gnl/TRDRNA2_/TRDRNA2_177650_c1~~gnl/TRDRNA2_/TRDRNA2_177650_c1_seq1.p1  ORF type:complete len:273 (+),score=90.44 gnl/TRDRNA2_/TRDRNA2_177650_c1_seq1:60-878(+)
MRTWFVLVCAMALGICAAEEPAAAKEPPKPGKVKHDYKDFASEVVEAQGKYAREIYESDIMQDYVAVPAANLKKAWEEGRQSFNNDPYVKQAKADMSKYTEKAKDKIRRFVESVGDITKTAEAELSLAQTDPVAQPMHFHLQGTEKDMADSHTETIIKLATKSTSEEGTDARAQRVRTLAAAKQLMKLMNVAAMAEERAKELIEEARKADAEADLVRAPIQDQSDKKARYHRAKTLQNAQTLNIEAAQSLVKARKLAGMVRELKESAKAKTA